MSDVMTFMTLGMVCRQLGGARGSRLAKDGWIVSVVEASEVKVRRLQTAETSALHIQFVTFADSETFSNVGKQTSTMLVSK